MIKYAVRNERITLFEGFNRLFSTHSLLADRASSPTTSCITHGKRYLQTSLSDDSGYATSSSPAQWGFKFGAKRQERDKTSPISNTLSDYPPSKWSSYSLPSKQALKEQQEEADARDAENRNRVAAAQEAIREASKPDVTEHSKRAKKRTLRPRKALITLSPTALSHLRGLLDQPEPKLIRIGVRNRGCSGLTYELQYITEPGKFDEIVEQDGVKVIIDSKALFSIVGSEMDWVDDKLSSRFVFKNPNSKGTCGCGESFMV
ncbi:hypothetical protein HG536_0D03760 [Torulaspora globosa]|uniref:Iron-sulfur assembly protein 1 n=1 Tax=Torulaspora globosa TaxID=48254 RepID=A0A7G3ZH68_9SACH|nr:uncharacterized protein HG536_0D03760 [Torulaspora globosa]QLL32854.1 hypothetical protein HG536_0D03760 [Torulaspora globosa]